MNLRTFSAPTFAKAIALVKSEMGSEAVILHTRTVRRRKWMGLRSREIVEITAGSGLNVPTRGGGAGRRGSNNENVAAGAGRGTAGTSHSRARGIRENPAIAAAANA